MKQFLDQQSAQPALEVLAQLVLIEIRCRNQSGESITFSDYYESYPLLKGLDYATIQNDSLAGSTQQTFAPSTIVPQSKAHFAKHELSAGEIIDDFELLANLGRGAFATVFLARQTSMQRLVALKVSRNLGSEPQTLAQMDHPNIVRVYDQRPAKQQDVHLLYMEYIARRDAAGLNRFDR